MKATSLFIKNLHDEVTENMLVQKFQVVGKVSVDIRKNDNCTNAFVYFDNHDDGKLFEIFVANVLPVSYR